ncbi:MULTISPECIES: 4'-phosphopantetheinyl transferase family protein [unclassified Pseudomonas]|uniref:4'-phosphopantetheinyl transferase family protein n=1 Tax=unclassified Pseudomonas TaxID=196821 RepID=UPI00215F1D2A|nr:4'-phosphopantetheinyl transferase superfamily protein [Pseudomonas sp. B21-015]UVM49091.1 4'-phosphopantetheinyl transferase superfamily protein [Pseudomonas sp. B21-015]
MNIPIKSIKLPEDCPADISLWLAHVRFDLPPDSSCFSELCADEKMRLAAFHQTADAARFASTRAALRILLSEKLGKPPGQISFTVDAYGRPSVKNIPCCEAEFPFLDFNVSHSGEYGLIALSMKRRVGVDIQQHTKLDWREVAAVTLSTDESAHIDQLDAPNQLATFYDYWSTKEALLKCVGVGISYGMKRISVHPRSQRSVKWLHPNNGVTRCYAAAPVDAPKNYAAQLAWSITDPC